MRAHGHLRHRFWGEYSAVIALKFDTPEEAAKALKELPDWKAAETAPSCITWVGDSAALELVKDKLETLGAERKKIDSIAKSIDYGEPFTVDVPEPVDYVNRELFA
jgi:hypothetical protein